MNISIIGTGYLGLTTASVLANSGHKVFAVDINPEIVKIIKTGRAHFFEPGLDDLVKKGIESGNLIPTLDYHEAIPNSEISFICVNTPGQDDGSLNLSGVRAACRSISENMNDGHIIVMKSTVPIGTHLEIKELINSITKKKFHYVSKPEFLSENSAVFDTILPDRIIVGTEDDSVFEIIFGIFKKVDDFSKTVDRRILTQYSKLYREKFDSDKPFEKRVIRVKTASAELIKVAANSFLATKISYANGIARLTDKCGADVNEVFNGIGADPRIGRDFFYAGLGWGGGCFPKDLDGLVNDAGKHGFDFGLLKEVDKINQDQIDFVKNKALMILDNTTSTSVVTVLGLAFKPGTDDVRISPATRLVQALSPYVEQIRSCDPEALENAKKFLTTLPNIYWAENLEDALKNSDLVILATDWPEYNDLDFESTAKLVHKKNLLDGRNRWDRKKAEDAGFTYQGVGR